MDFDKIKDSFKEKFEKEPQIFRSPGRINLIGEHTDYNDGFVFPAAIDKEMVAAIAANGKESLCRLYAIDLDDYFEFDLAMMKPDEKGWANYLMGVADQIQKKGKELKGFDCVFGGDVPLGSGLSSSAALECVTAYALNHLFDLGLDKKELVLISQMAEHTFAGVKCGVMDQFASVMGKKNAALRLDCRTLEYEHFPLDLQDYQILLLNTNVKHSLASSEYNTRREECEEGVGILKRFYPEIKNLRDVDLEMINNQRPALTTLVYDRCSFVIEENKRVLESSEAMQAGELVKLGQLIYASHEGLSKKYEVSCAELDFLVEATKDKDYILGARMMGGGFGGCTINIIKKDKIQSFIDEISPLYKKEFNLDLTPILVSVEEGSSGVK